MAVYSVHIDVDPIGDEDFHVLAYSPRTGQRERKRVRLAPGHKLLERTGSDIALDNFYERVADLPADVVLEFGQALFKLLFEDAVRDVVMTEFGEANRAGKPFRMLVGAQGQDGGIPARIPFEYLTDRVQNGFWFRRPTCSVVRQLVEMPGVVPTRGRRLLFVVSNPRGSEVVNAFDDSLPDRLRAQMERAGFVVDFRRGLTRSALGDIVAGGSGYQWLHFLGHGDVARGTGVLYLEDGEGGADPVTGADLANLLRPLGIQTVFLQACFGGIGSRPYSGVAQTFLSQAGVAMAIGSLSSISADHSTTFAMRFYDQLRRGRSVDQARQLALNVAYPQDEPEWGLLGLFARTDQLTHELLQEPWEVYLESAGAGNIRLTSPSAPVPVQLSESCCEELKHLHQQHLAAPDDQVAILMSHAVRNFTEAATLFPPAGFSGDVAFRGALSSTSYPWEQLPDPVPGQPLFLRQGICVVREMSELGARIEECGSKGAAAICLSPYPEDAESVRQLVPRPMQMAELEGDALGEECSCVVLTVRVEQGRPQLADAFRGSRAMRDTDLLLLRDQLWRKQPNLAILDFVGDGSLTTPMESTSASGTPPTLIETLLRLSFAEVVLAPALSFPRKEWRDRYLRACSKIVHALEEGACLRNAMSKFDASAMAATLPVFCVKSSFRRTL